MLKRTIAILSTLLLVFAVIHVNARAAVQEATSWSVNDDAAELSGGSGDGWQAEYFNNTTWAGTPALTRTDGSLDFEWGEGSPGAGVDADFFSARWTGPLRLDEDGLIRFTLSNDDRMRLLIDGELIAENLNPGTTAQLEHQLMAGDHTLTVEYVEYVGNAFARFDFQTIKDAPPEGGDGWQAEYFANPTLSNDPTLTRFEPSPGGQLLFFQDWYLSSPSSAIPVDNFSSRWTRRVMVREDTTAIVNLFGDDELRVLVDGVEQARIEQVWTNTQVTFPIQQGMHTIVVEHREYGVNAIARFSMGFEYEIPIPGGDGWNAEYFNNTTWAGTPALTRTDGSPNFEWGETSPGAGVNADFFSVRWTAPLRLDEDGLIRFTLSNDDRMRLLIDGELIAENLNPGSTEQISHQLAAGDHTLTVEYVEYVGNAFAQFDFQTIKDK